MDLYERWDSHHVEDKSTLLNMIQLFYMDVPKTGGFDTETTGLHIMKDKPFLIQFGWLVPKENFGRVFTFYPTQENMKVFFELAKLLKYFIAHNIKYDSHMLSNIGYATEVQAMTNLVENMAVARLSLEAIPAREGGDSLKLKSLGVKYVSPKAAESESKIQEELNKLNAVRIKILTAALKQFPLEGETTATGRQKFWGKGAIEKFLKDPTNDLEDLPQDVQDVWVDWLEEYPEPTWEDVPRDIMIQYGAEDVITMLEFFRKAYPILVERKQLELLNLESECILPTYRMERVGLKVNSEYLEESRVRVKNYISKLRNELYEIAEEKVTVGQHERLKALFSSKWGISMESADGKAMKDVMKHHEGEPKRFAQLIKALRSLEKWYSTYIKRIITLASYDGKVYTQINLNGAVSGRMSSDFQQFPKKALLTLEGEELYHPRKPFIPKGGDYESICYID